MAMNPNTQAYFDSAKKLRLTVVEEPVFEGFTMHLGRHRYHFFQALTPCNNCTSTFVAANKFTANSLLRNAGIPVPKSTYIAAEDFSYDVLAKLITDFKFPLVLKPLSWTGQGIDVICNIPDMYHLSQECEKLVKKYPHVMIEEFHGGLYAFRVLVFKNKILDIIERYPARIVGDGTHTVSALIESENEKRKAISSFLLPITLDFEAMQCLKKLGYTEYSVPREQETVVLGYTSNASRGGTIKAYKREICNENIEMVFNIMQLLNLDLAGIDIECKTLEEPIGLNNGVVLEVNHCPSLRIHEEGVAGTEKKVSLIVMRSFIWKHPFSYILQLFFNKKRITTNFARSAGVMMVCVIMLFYLNQVIG